MIAALHHPLHAADHMCLLLAAASCCITASLQVKASHVTDVDYNRAAAGEWITPAPLPAVPALGSMPGMAGMPNLGAGLMPGLAGLPGFAGLQGLAGMTAPLSVPAMAGSIPGLGAAAGLNPLLGFPPPP